MAPGETFLLFALMCWPSWPCVSWVLLGGLCNTGRSQGIAVLPSPGVKCLTMMLAIYLAKEVAAILRAILTHPTKRLYDDMTAHLLCSNYWMQPIFQELLHSLSRYNATRTGERNRPSSGLARISAHPRPPKKLKPSASGTRFTDWIGGICYADTLQVWFPAHWTPVILHQLQHTEDAYRAAHPSWMDLEVAPDDIKTQWQEANANRRMQFKVGDYKDSNIRMLTGTIKADWIQLPVERYLTALPTLKQGVIAGCSRTRVPLLGPSLGPRSYSSRCSFPMTCHWMIGMQEYTPGPLCGLMCLCWEPTICVEWSAMTFTTYGRSMMSQACGATSTHNGDYCSSIWKPKGLVGTRSLREKSGFLPTGLIGLEMIWNMNFVLTVILLRGVCGVLLRTSYGSYASQLHP